MGQSTLNAGGASAVRSWCLLAFVLLASPLRLAADEPVGGRLVAAPIPGGVEGVRRALGDRLAPDPALLVADLARRFHDAPLERDSPRAAALARLVTALEAAPAAGSGDVFPLPGSARFWSDVVLRRPVAPDRLLAAIVADRGAVLLHSGLLSLDEPTRAWLVGDRTRIRTIVEGQAPAFAIAAPWVRVRGGRLVLPGSPDADPVWEALAGVALDDPAEALPRVLAAADGRVAHLVELLGMLDPSRVRAVLRLDADVSVRVQAGRALLEAVGRAIAPWRPAERPFQRPSFDPALALRAIGFGVDGAARLPGTRASWAALYGTKSRAADNVSAGPLTASWLLSHVAAVPDEATSRLATVLFASRHFAGAALRDDATVWPALRVHRRHPALVNALERAGIVDAPTIVAAGEAADRLQRIPNRRRRSALGQWQGALALILHLGRSGTLGVRDTTALVTRLAEAEADPGSAAGRILSLLVDLAELPPGTTDARARPLESALLARLTRAPAWPGTVAWEGVAYRIDVEAAERRRLADIRTPGLPPWLDAARIAVSLADALERGHGDRAAALRVELDLLLASVPGSEAARHAVAAPALREAAADLASRGCVELAYALALGSGDMLPIRSGEAAARHAFGPSETGDAASAHAWHASRIVVETGRPWHVEGSLFDLDVTLAPLGLRRRTLRPPPAAPSLNEGDRRVLVESVPLLDRRGFSPDAQQAVATAMVRARQAVATAASADAALALARRACVSPMREGLAPWVFEYDRAHWPHYFGPRELLAIGLADRRPGPWLEGWGNSDRPVTGRLAAGSVRAEPWEWSAGRLGTGLLAAATPDLQLRLVELLHGLDLPAFLVPDLMRSTVLDLVNLVPSRHPDDWRALVAHVQGLDVAAVERALGLLTTGGPLRVQGR